MLETVSHTKTHEFQAVIRLGRDSALRECVFEFTVHNAQRKEAVLSA